MIKINQVNNLKEAKKQFKINANDIIVCKLNKRELVVNSYEDAARFYNSNGLFRRNPEELFQILLNCEEIIKESEKAIELLNNSASKLQLISADSITRFNNYHQMMINSCKNKKNFILTYYPEVNPFYVMHKITE